MKIQQGLPLPLGVTLSDSRKKVQISVWAKDEDECTLELYVQGKAKKKIKMESMSSYGARDIFSVCLYGENIVEELSQCEYLFSTHGKTFIDPYVRKISGANKFGKRRASRGCFHFDEFDWNEEKRKSIDFSDMILYQCHVRGFTKDVSSHVKNPGTFDGLREKISYLKELGINTLLCLPFYEFDEIFEGKDGTKKLNYWGYTPTAYYFAPKASYTSEGKDPSTELKQLVCELHKQDMNMIMDIHFTTQTPDFILDCLRYYVTEFHVDGFLVNQNVVYSELVMNDPVLRNVKLLGTGWPNLQEKTHSPRLGCYNDGFLVDARRFLKSDEGMVSTFYEHFKNQGGSVAIINYITQTNGFTLKDLVSYDVKHNEKNNEKNQDGTEYNYSWNCGAEGTTRRKSVLAMREQQMRNAFAMLLLSVGTPMILAGDEFANTQKGNNNAYCQDNTTTWLDWKDLDKNKELFRYVKSLIEFRKNCGIYNGKQLRGMDYRGLGAPDVSCHGIEPWVTGFVNYSRELGILFYKTYFDVQHSIYLAINMHWEKHEFFLPDVMAKSNWKVLFDTSKKSKKEFNSKKNSYVMDPRTIAVFEEVPESVLTKSRDCS